MPSRSMLMVSVKGGLLTLSEFLAQTSPSSLEVDEGFSV